MRINLDTKFIATTIITVVILIVVVVLISTFVGSAAATVAGTVLGGILLKIFDKLDYTPTTHIEIGSQTSQIMSTISGIFILFGCTIFAKFSRDIFQLIYGNNYIFKPLSILIILIMNLGGLILAGWLIGQIYPYHALRITAIAGFLLVIATTVNAETGEFLEKFNNLLDQSVRRGIVKEMPTHDDMGYIIFGKRTAAVVFGILKVYVAIVMARVSSRKNLRKQSGTA